VQGPETGGGVVRGRRYSGAEINEAFNEFLHIRVADRKILQTYREALTQGGEQFAQVFYAYLLAYPATAQVLEDYQRQGGKIEDLVKKQLQHLFELLDGETDADSARRMAYIGGVHYRYRIEPVWIMGAYLLYLSHLQSVIRTHPLVKDSDRGALEDCITKLLFRDVGLMLEGYWDASMQALDDERAKVGALQQQITSLLSNIPQLLWSIDVVNNRPLYVSPSTREICGLDIDLPIPCLGWTIAEDKETVRMAWFKALQGDKVEVESRVQQPGGDQRWFRRVFYPSKDDSGRVTRIDGLMEDTTEAREIMKRLHALATTDSLTGLPNRALLNDRFTLALAAAARDGEKQVVLMLMDLDRFKEINDTLGHAAGDRILIAVAERLSTVLRESDTLARLGGDEFAILLPNVTDGRRTVEKVANKLLQCFTTPFKYGDNELFLGAGLGVVIYPEHGEDVSTLMSRADVAMYGTKNRDVGYLYYDAALDPNTQHRLQLSGELRRALAREELTLHYQPKIDIRSGRVMSAEALIRWRHPRHGLLAPDQFIPMAERSGLIRPITDWVIETATNQCRDWHQAGHPLRVAVNIPGRVFQDPELVQRVTQILGEIGTPAHCLEIEITENVLMADIEHISRILGRISDLGVHISIDDFGTGYSSLAYLKKLPLHTLKIDKSFVMDMARDENDAAIVRSTVDLAHNLGYRVVAEGVENHDTYQLLSGLGCDGAQGYHISRPLPVDEYNRWLRESSWAGHA
jgi:diguanylate cyclase (GGDEF)-like protein